MTEGEIVVDVDNETAGAVDTTIIKEGGDTASAVTVVEGVVAVPAITDGAMLAVPVTVVEGVVAAVAIREGLTVTFVADDPL